MLQTEFYGSLVPKDAQSANHGFSLIIQVAMMPERFALMDIADMNLDEGNIHTRKSISNCDTRMCEGTWVNDDSFDLVYPRLVDAVDNCAFPVGLEVRECYAGGVCFALCFSC